MLIYRNKQGRITRPAPFQSSVKSGEVARVEPNKKWFGKSDYVVHSRVCNCAV